MVPQAFPVWPAFAFIAARRAPIACHTARRSSSSSMPQTAISSSVRWQPVHNPVASSILHTLMQGEGTADAAAGMATSISPRVVDDAGDGKSALQRADLVRDLADRLVGNRQPRYVRRHRDFRPPPEGMGGVQRLLAKYIQGRARQFAAVEQGEQIVLDQQIAAADVDHVRAVGQ